MNRRPPLTDIAVLEAIQHLEVNGATITQRALVVHLGGSYTTMRVILDRLAAAGKIQLPPSQVLILTACLARRAEQVDALVEWANTIERIAAGAGLRLPAIPLNLGSAVFGSSSWPRPTRSATRIDLPIVLLDSEIDGFDPSPDHKAVGSHLSALADVNRCCERLCTSEHSTCSQVDLNSLPHDHDAARGSSPCGGPSSRRERHGEGQP
jgi:hypothetical protein